jgi:phage-related minor tail protein
MDTRFVVRGPHSPEKIKAYQRLKGAGRDLAEAIAEQREQMKRLQGNLNSLDEALDRVTDSMARAASVGGDEE